MKELRIFAVVADEKIQPAIVVVIAYGKASPDARRAKIRTLRFRRIYETALPCVAIELLFFFVGDFGMIDRDVVEDVAVDDEQVAPAIIVEIEKSRAESAAQEIRLANAGRDCVVRESAVAIIAIHAIEFVIKMADEKIS